MKKTQANEEVAPTFWNAGDWTIYFTKAGMLNTVQNEQFASIVKVRRIPDVFNGFNALYLINPKRDFVYKVTAIDSLKLCSLEERKGQELLTLGKEQSIDELQSIVDEKNKKYGEAKEIYDPINALPELMLAKQSDTWLKKDFSKIKDFQHIEVTDDWTYTSPYKGSLDFLSKSPVPNFSTTVVPEHSSVTTQPTHDQIPFHKLGQDNPVLKFDEIHFFEDDLDDLGFAQSLVRIRTMADSFYMLLRNYVRVDELVVRVMDTRVYHALGSNELLREFQYKECSYKDLAERGFEFSSQWVLSPNQADTVFQHLDLNTKFLDKILI